MFLVSRPSISGNLKDCSFHYMSQKQEGPNWHHTHTLSKKSPQSANKLFLPFPPMKAPAGMHARQGQQLTWLQRCLPGEGRSSELFLRETKDAQMLKYKFASSLLFPLMQLHKCNYVSRCHKFFSGLGQCRGKKKKKEITTESLNCNPNLQWKATTSQQLEKHSKYMGNFVSPKRGNNKKNTRK